MRTRNALYGIMQFFAVSTVIALTGLCAQAADTILCPDFSNATELANFENWQPGSGAFDESYCSYGTTVPNHTPAPEGWTVSPNDETNFAGCWRGFGKYCDRNPPAIPMTSCFQSNPWLGGGVTPFDLRVEKTIPASAFPDPAAPVNAWAVSMTLSLHNWGFCTTRGPGHAQGNGYVAVLDDAGNTIAKVGFKVTDNADPAQTRSQILLNDLIDIVPSRTGVGTSDSSFWFLAYPEGGTTRPMSAFYNELVQIGDDAAPVKRFVLTITGDSVLNTVQATFNNLSVAGAATATPLPGANVGRPAKLVFQCGSDGTPSGGCGFMLWQRPEQVTLPFTTTMVTK